MNMFFVGCLKLQVCKRLTAHLGKASFGTAGGTHLQLCIQVPDPDVPPCVPNRYMLLPAVTAHAVDAVQAIYSCTDGEQQAGSAAHLPHTHATITYKHTTAPATQAQQNGPSHETDTSRAWCVTGALYFWWAVRFPYMRATVIYMQSSCQNIMPSMLLLSTTSTSEFLLCRW